MPATDPSFQHSDEDWTQITQPRLRKRVQNRVSQRKHRNKVRQQRADSIDAGHNVPNPTSTAGYWPPASSVASSATSIAGDDQYSQHGLEPAKRPSLETTICPEQVGLDSFNYNILDGCSPWTGSPSSAYPQSSPYPAVASYGSGDSSHHPGMYIAPSAGSSKRPSISSSNNSSVYDIGNDGVDTSSYGLSHHWYHMPPSSMSPNSYSTSNTSVGLSPTEQQPYDVWQPQRAREMWSSCGSGLSPLAGTKPSDPTGNGYCVSSRSSSMTGASGRAGASTPAYGVKSSTKYAADRGNYTIGDGIEPRGSGINPACYKSGKHSQTSSKSKPTKVASY